MLLTLGLFRDDVTYNDYYNAIYNSNLESLHAFFNAYTEEEINELFDNINKSLKLFLFKIIIQSIIKLIVNKIHYILE